MPCVNNCFSSSTKGCRKTSIFCRGLFGPGMIKGICTYCSFKANQGGRLYTVINTGQHEYFAPACIIWTKSICTQSKTNIACLFCKIRKNRVKMVPGSTFTRMTHLFGWTTICVPSHMLGCLFLNKTIFEVLVR
ncbi:hypothetical protein HanPI659440_Chr13g0518601 [Helianthus annuus]|nr:hypothetical protein HanPI659440_Chr13g0518601 [Helianthus annuus]